MQRTPDLEECPYCGKPFKRLKTHMPHCKKAPASQPKKTNHMSKELSKSPSRSKTLEDNNNKKLPIKSKMTGDLSSGATDQVSPSETLEMKTPKSNGLSKGQKEFERLQWVPVSQNSTKAEHSVKLSTKPDHGTSQTSGKEECPYCGKPFKRLKTHMPHCKKAPGSQPKKTNHMSKELSKSPSRSKTLEDNNNEKLPIKSKMTGDLSSGATDQVSPSETLEMKTPKSNGLSKGQKEFERLQLVPVSQNSTKTSVKLSTKPDHVTSKHHTPKMPLSEGLSKTSSETIRSGTDPTILKKDSPANETSVQHELLKPKTKLEELERPTNKDFSLALQAKEHQTLKKNIIFTSKTSVWDHISDSLYKKKYVVPLVNIEPFKFSAVEDRRISAVLQSNNKGETNLPKVFVPLPILSSSHRPTEDICGSRQGRVSSPVPEPAADGNRIQFSTVNHNKGWQCYLRKYRGRIGGITMLLAGCCVLSYVWSLPHQKKDR